MFVIGAGFSAAGGLPLGPDLFSEIRRRAARLEASVLEADIERYQEYVARTTGKVINSDSIDFEKFMSFLDVEHFLRLQGSDTWTNEGSKSQNLVRTIIAEILFVAQEAIGPRYIDIYDEFARRLDPNEFILTFNYDTVLEDALDRRGRPYRLFPQRYGFIMDHPDEEIAIIKLHGSIDWFDIKPHLDEEAYKAKTGTEHPSQHTVFGSNGIPCQKIVDDAAEVPNDSSLHRVFRVKNLRDYLQRSELTIWPPLIVSPSFSKMLFLDPLTEFWDGMRAAGATQKHLTIIGYSLPLYDEYIRQVLYSIVLSFENYDTKPYILKEKLRFVDYQQSDTGRQAYRENYRFADWTKAEAWFDGFGEKALDFIFPLTISSK